MKSISKFLALLTFATVPLAANLLHAQDGPPPPPDAGAGPSDQSDDDQGASFQQFYDQLGEQGNWVQTNDYGYVFQPNVQDPNWAPYSDGHWAYTDEGWMWVSDEPWGWATYHYGRWANIDGTGWVWVPGYQWAPAWVSWRYGGGYCGWAPLPPETFIGAEYAQPGFAVGVGFHFGGDVDVSFNIGPGCYNFVRVGDFGERNYRGRYIDRSRNYTVINNTTNITNININKTVINNGNGNINARGGRNFRGVAVGGPPINEVNAHSRQRINTVHLAEANQPGRATQNGDTLSVYAPRVNAASAHQAKPARVAQTIDHPKFNRGDSITQPMQVTSGLKGHEASAADIQAARTAAAQAPARAKIATEKTEARTQFTQPLTSLQPVAERHHGPQKNATGVTTAPNNNNAGNTGAAHTETPAFTGEQNNGAVNHPAKIKSTPQNTYQPQTETPGHENAVKAKKKNTEAESPYTGGNPSGGQVQHVPRTQTYQPQSQSETPTRETQTHPSPARERQVEKQTQTPQSQTYHPQSQGGGNGGAPPQHQAPVHQQAPAPQPAATRAAPAPREQAPPAAGKGAKDNKDNGQNNSPQGH